MAQYRAPQFASAPQVITLMTRYAVRLRSLAIRRVSGKRLSHTRHYAKLMLVSVLSACTPAALPFTSEFLSMGTLARITLHSSDAATAAQLSARIEQHWQVISREWYPYGANTAELARLNTALAHGATFTASASLVELLNQAKALQQRSDGYFDPAIAPMVQAWGMDTAPASSHTASAALIAAWQHAHPTLDNLLIADQQLSSARRDLMLDLGAIAKGYALDQAASELRAAHTAKALQAQLNLGGQWLILGSEVRLPLRSPRGTQALAEVLLRDGESLATSGDYQRFVEHSQQRVSHLLDPHTGIPVQHTQAVSVIANSGTLADAASTALMAAGPSHWLRIARQLGVNKVLRVDASGHIEVTRAMVSRLSGLAMQSVTVMDSTVVD